ncbi:PAAR domain-containing protein [Janthinobacterium fluminis]|uniref:PAAR domain-containing protein n=1 Tax=Janthinobacterium fluminis TaxID=2987524 RepID=A0ABT5JYR2_9BURK|nr:PAAR domain-containing protein [Janthinobacterium fluminis]MDC8756672.1 PAAR domain-containing protein [Janthinobacterium fluminis]
MRNVIRLNDPTSHGGIVASVAAPHFTVDGIAVARVGDRCSCPIPGHSNCVIVEGDPQHTIDGVAVAYEGHKTSCGAVLISTAGNFGRL